MARQIGWLRAWTECAALGPAWALMRTLPIERSVPVGAALGSILMTLDMHDRRIARRNLEIAFPEMDHAARMRILRGAYRNFGRMAAEWIHFPELARDNIEIYTSYEGREYWEDALRLSKGRGILILTGHFGNFELLSLAHSIYGNKAAIVHRPNRNPVIDEAVTTRRTRFGNRVIPRKGAGRHIIRLLRQDWMVAIPLDLDTRRGVFVDFFGLKASTSDALARVAMSTGAPVLPFFPVRQGSSSHHVMTFLPVVDIVNDGDRDEAVRENTQRFTSIIEMMIERHPDHWNWIHRRWKTRPPGDARFY